MPGEVILRLDYCFISVGRDGVGSDGDVWVTAHYSHLKLW